MQRASIFSDFLTALGVPHTQWYSDAQFDAMTFKSLFGLSKLLQGYGIDGEALEVPDKNAALDALTVPYLAYLPGNFVIVTATDGSSVTYLDGTADAPAIKSREDFCKDWSGIVFVAYPTDKSTEPHYASHRFTELGNKAKKWVLGAALAFVFVYLFVSGGIASHWSTILLTIINLGGLYVTYELLLKSLGMHSERGDAICGVLDRNGCHKVLNTSAAKFFGLFGWSEVGFAYFGVSLAALLAFPQHIGDLALINACCCPFSFWSVWYQKYRAKAWCTLCLITQALLWLSLACYIFGGWFRHSFPPGISFFVLGAAYVIALLGINALMPCFNKNRSNDETD